VVPIGLFILVEQFLSRNLLRRNILQNRRHDALVGRQHDKAREILKEKEPVLHALAKRLYEKETITGEEFIKILKEEQAMCILPSRDEEQK
jgi:hypothetical protein